MQWLQFGVGLAIQGTTRRPRPRRQRTTPVRDRLRAALFRMRLGRLLNQRYLMLAYTPRRTIRRAQRVLPVWRYDPQLHESVVLVRGDAPPGWFRAVAAIPARDLWSGSRCFVPVQRRLSTGEIAECLLQQARSEPRRLTGLLRSLGYGGALSPERLRQIGSSLHGFAFRPHQILY